MTKRSVTHSTFTLERVYDAPPARVFAAFSSRETKAQWFAAPEDWGEPVWEMDFRVGGKEYNRSGPKGGPQHAFDALYMDIVDNERIVYAYNMFVGDAKLSASLTTIELRAEGKKTRLVLTEQGAFLDGHDTPRSREEGTRGLLEAIAPVVERSAS